MNHLSAENALTRILDALEVELVTASDEEISDAHAALGIKPEMKFSTAWAAVLFELPDWTRGHQDRDSEPRDSQRPKRQDSQRRETD